MSLLDSAWGLALSGVVCGALLGALARKQHFCTLGALERFWYANDSRGVRIWALAIAVAILTTKLFSDLGWANVQNSYLLSSPFNLAAAVIGGFLFGIGMALVGTCSFGALVRLGGGSLRSLIVLATIGVAALAMQRGLLGPVREKLFEYGTIHFPQNNQSIAELISTAIDLPLQWPITLLVCIGLIYWVFKEAFFRRSISAIMTGGALGVLVSAGWVISSYFERTLFEPVQIESASFVAPPGDILLSFIARTGGIPDYAMSLTLGVVIGAAMVAYLNDDVRWEACDSAQELGRHLIGALLMGIGGILALGCTIGQGISAASLLCVSAPIVLFSIVVGAKLGLSFIMGGLSLGIRAE